MKIDIDQDGNLVLREVYCNTLLETQEGNQFDTFGNPIWPPHGSGHGAAELVED